MCKINYVFSFKKVKSYTVPTKAYSASLHPSKSCFVVGGEDFKIYKFDYDDGKELGKLTMCIFEDQSIVVISRILQRTLWSCSLCAVQS